ncbi:MAG: ComEA family DNA-binding protein [Coleofasciculaceae cyanobacterium SM2_1_6]|nr:ComEA family DNA-binding protein [Coleofasciculaceae cyanobacterium SM2_1_6]
MALFSQSKRQRILADVYYRLQSLEEVAIAAQLGRKVDVNRAVVDDWLRLPGISIHQARQLVQLNQAGVQFYCLEDIAAALSLPPNYLKPLEIILDFYYYPPETLPRSAPINANLAQVQELQTIPGLTPALAAAIVIDRQTQGKYKNLADLQARLALPGEITAQIMHYLNFSG